MKIRKYLAHVAAIIVVAFGTTQLFAALADVDNYGAKGNALSQTESVATWSSSVGDHVVYTFYLTHTVTDSTNNVASQAIDLTGLVLESIQLFEDGGTPTRDVNIILQGSNTLDATYFAASPYTRTTALNGDLDDVYPDGVGTPIVFDPTVYWQNLTSAGDSATIAIPDPISRCRYYRVVSDGQTGNTVTAAANRTVVIVKCRKVPGISRGSYELVNTN